MKSLSEMDIVQYIVMNKTVVDKLSRGALGAQVAHAAIAPITMQLVKRREQYTNIENSLDPIVWHWVTFTFTKIVLGCSGIRLAALICELEEREIKFHIIRESRLAGVITGIGLLPQDKERVAPFFKDLRTLT